MSVLISGVLMNPAGVPVSGAEVTFSALTNGPSVLNGFSASVMTDQDGNYAIPLEICEYAISIQSDGYNSVYGSVSINEKSTPATINELLKLAAMEQAVTPAIIVYFREIQTDVAAKLATMQTLNNSATTAMRDAITARNEAAQYAQSLSAAAAQAQQASASAAASSNASGNSANEAVIAKNAAEVAAGNAQAVLADTMKRSANGVDIADKSAFRANIGLSNAMLRGEFGWGGRAVDIPGGTDILSYFATPKPSGIYSATSGGFINGPVGPNGLDSGKYEWIQGLDGIYGTLRFTSYNIPYYSAETILDAGIWRGWVTSWDGKDGVGKFLDARDGKISGNPESLFGRGFATGLVNSASLSLPGVHTALTINAQWQDASGIEALNRTAITGGRMFYQQAISAGDWSWPWTELASTNTTQDITELKTFHKDNSAFNIKAATLGNASYIFAQDADLSNSWYIGRGSNNNKTVSFSNYVGNAGMHLSPDGSVRFDASNVTFAGGSLGFMRNAVAAAYSDGGQFAAALANEQAAGSCTIAGVWRAFLSVRHRGGEPGSDSTSWGWALVDNAMTQGNFNEFVLEKTVDGTFIPAVHLKHSGNTTIDANGFLKTASPVINIYADGSFTTTDEAAGVDVERLSEGVYKITGCQGMHPDAAWNGIDGGVSNPKCRNGLELTWNDFSVESDGSVIVRTYHRPHPDAISFARNEIEGYGNDDPIDVPRGLFIQVRVNMPSRDERQHAPATRAISHSNVYCNSVSPT
ncbi:prophage tail fiber N-terminal domain-containing protein [Pectobacterium aquaticum]|uniref:Lambda-like tail fibre protein N-terminal domain-containing protein n=1 Tax=Pectobacterium aquaticum TaxID=2204145 RepID=A0AA93AID2_9GAMM|nr:prophage tail fiber N-terminal domain-containing protein [Pectobacterium aquaticum]RRO05023.1 hypothetical protein DMB85_017920 [Pectobacterium aquaticum]RRO10574.1 hypothetical protein DMB84_020330 [Pectobacterium aquaticum]